MEIARTSGAYENKAMTALHFRDHGPTCRVFHKQDEGDNRKINTTVQLLSY